MLRGISRVHVEYVISLRHLEINPSHRQINNNLIQWTGLHMNNQIVHTFRVRIDIEPHAVVIGLEILYFDIQK